MEFWRRFIGRTKNVSMMMKQPACIVWILYTDENITVYISNDNEIRLEKCQSPNGTAQTGIGGVLNVQCMTALTHVCETREQK